MYTASTIAAVLALAAGANAGVCGNIDRLYNRNRQECESVGCYYSPNNRCEQPPACTASGTVMYDGRSTGVSANRKPIGANIARLCDQNEDCSAIYSVSLSKTWNTGAPNCNDAAMLPPHGADQTPCTNLYSLGQNYIGHPFPSNSVKQSLAESKNAVTALTEETERCFGNDDSHNPHCAFPLGFYSDTIKKNLKICVRVYGVEDKWVEIMASSKGADGSFCVRDRLKDDAMGGDTGCTKTGDLYDVRESGQSAGSDNMFIEFYTADNFDDANLDISWRIAASEEPSHDPSSNEDKDAEDWSQHRDGTDFPMSLMNPYPEGFEGEPVFETVTGSSATFASPAIFVVLAATIIAALL